MTSRALLFIGLATVFITGCKQKPDTLFDLLSAADTGIEFANTLTETDSLNILNQANIYNGGGVGVGDFNNDGLQDLFFAANMVSNRLYINKGSLSFEDVSETAGVTGNGRWCTGVSVVDINSDGWLDIYVSASFREDSTRRTNLLYINSGQTPDNKPVFKELAASYGLADTGFSTQGIFFDYDKDGDLDMYLVTNEIYDPRTPIHYRPKLTDGSAKNTDRLYRNNGNNTFSNVSREAGILIEGWGHAASISDFNLDGWPDIFVSNDFISNDLLYINNGNGTFTNRIAEYIKHGAWNAMGTDVVDINNDGYDDMISLEMLPEDNMRKKKMLGGEEYFNYFNSRKFKYEHQYVRNVLQLNAGQTPAGHPVFSEVAFLAGVYQTDWSWAPLVADFDNDGWRDIIITNGLPRDVTDLDYIKYGNGQGKDGRKINAALSMVDSLPVVKIAGYAFHNQGGINFSDSTRAWGLDQPSFSNGAAYTDLDNDGDLDVVINNINDKAFVYENKTQLPSAGGNHYISLGFKGTEKNPRGYGARVQLYRDGRQWLYNHYPCRGYLSTVDGRGHIGLHNYDQLDSIRVIWPDGTVEVKTNVRADQLLVLSHSDASANNRGVVKPKPFFASVARDAGINYIHEERDAIDYNIQSILPHKLSQYGPGIAVGDVDGNGFDDFYVTGNVEHPGTFFMQDARGRFTSDRRRLPAADAGMAEELGALLFDADGDLDLDLYTACGSYEFAPDDPSSQDKLYLNNGRGMFQRSVTALPLDVTNGSCVRAADYDQDGDLDLFVGGRSVSGAYPQAANSFILENRGGLFIDVTAQVCKSLVKPGMITDALWTDFDNDGKIDLITTGEWMPVNIYRNVGDNFEKVEQTGIADRTGWWNSLASGDFDNDGDIDYIAGNLGLNSSFKASPSEPMTILAKDLNRDGKIDPMIFCFMKGEDGVRRAYPMHTRDDLITQMASMRGTFPTYRSYGRATIDKLWDKENLESALRYDVNTLQSSYIENKGGGKFEMVPLPIEAQVAPLYGMVVQDINNDRNLDLIVVGNDYAMEPFAGRHDALNGLCLVGDGKGNWRPLSVSESGFFVAGDAKGMATLKAAVDGRELILCSQNLDSLKAFTNTKYPVANWIKLNADDVQAEFLFSDGTRQKREYHIGAGYLSQSSRNISLSKDVKEVILTTSRGAKRTIRVRN